jgi:glycosyltransferase involved in cell wall biosynthesis
MSETSRKTTVAAVIPTYNRAGLLAFSLDSVLQQSRPADDVVVVDDGSTDGTAALLASYGDRIRRIHQSNGGKASALNRALSTITSEYVWFMDDDDLAVPDALARHVEFLAGHPCIDFSWSDVYCFEGNEAGPPLDRCHLWRRPVYPHTDFFVRAMETFPANLQTMLVPRTCYEAIGGLDETMKFGEDYDVILRLARRFRAGWLAKPTVLLRGHPGDRGPASARHGAESKWAAWRLYDRKIFTKLRKELSLDEYMPRDGLDWESTDAQQRRALLQRACIMSRHGLFDEALHDLEKATAAPLMRAPLTHEEQSLCGRMLDFEDSALTPPADFVRTVVRLLRRRAPDLVKHAIKGLYWTLRRAAKTRDYRLAAESGTRLAQMLVSTRMTDAGRKPER